MLRFFLLLATCSVSWSTSQAPNIIFILCDDLGYGDVGVFYQNERSRKNLASEPWHLTPELDKMASEGVMMPHHYSAAPVCAPARASLLSGVHQGHSNVRNNQFDKALEPNHTLASILHRSGYATFAIGKWGLQGHKASNQIKTDFPAHPLRRGFDEFFGLIAHKDGHRHYPKENQKRLLENNNDVTAQYDKCYTTDLFTARAKKWIIDHQSSAPKQPFFIYLSYGTPHAQLQVPTGEYPSGGGLNGGLQWTGLKGQMITTAQGTPDSWIHPDYRASTWTGWDGLKAPKPWPNIYKRYATMVRRIDDGVGDLIQLLKDLHIDKNTLIVFTSDNGASRESYLKKPLRADFFNSFGPFDGIKRDLWEGGIRVGALARWPKAIPAGTISKHPTAFWDWMPTFSEMAGKPAPARSDGISLMPTLTGIGIQEPATLYFEYEQNNKTPSYSEFQENHRGRKRGEMQAIRMGDYVGVRYDIQSHQDPFEIYNIVQDPQQSINIATQQVDLQKQMHETTLQMRRANTTAKRPYDNEPVPSVATPEVEQGLVWKSFKLDCPWVANTDRCTDLERGSTRTLSLDGIDLKGADQALISGFINIPKTGDYTFSIRTMSKAVIRLHNAILIDADSKYREGAKRSTKIRLEKGMHPIRCYLKLGKNKKLDFHWASPGLPKQVVPAEAFYREHLIK